jgi:hypothetical protein
LKGTFVVSKPSLLPFSNLGIRQPSRANSYSRVQHLRGFFGVFLRRIRIPEKGNTVNYGEITGVIVNAKKKKHTCFECSSCDSNSLTLLRAALSSLPKHPTTSEANSGSPFTAVSITFRLGLAPQLCQVRGKENRAKKEGKVGKENGTNNLM